MHFIFIKRGVLHELIISKSLSQRLKVGNKISSGFVVFYLVSCRKRKMQLSSNLEVHSII